MGKVEQIERAIKALSPDELEQLRAWFADFDAVHWDRQLEADVASGRLDKLAPNTRQVERRRFEALRDERLLGGVSGTAGGWHRGSSALRFVVA